MRIKTIPRFQANQRPAGGDYEAKTAELDCEYNVLLNVLRTVTWPLRDDFRLV